jgi:hypothetical protein
MMRARFQASMNRLPASVLSNVEIRLSDVNFDSAAARISPAIVGGCLFIRVQLPSQLQEKHEAVASGHTAGHPPLNSIPEQQRANQLNQKQNDQEISHARAGAGHQRPAGVEFAFGLLSFVAPPRGILNHPKTDSENRADQQSCQFLQYVDKIVGHRVFCFVFWQAARELPPAQP